MVLRLQRCFLYQLGTSLNLKVHTSAMIKGQLVSQENNDDDTNNDDNDGRKVK